VSRDVVFSEGIFPFDKTYNLEKTKPLPTEVEIMDVDESPMLELRRGDNVIVMPAMNNDEGEGIEITSMTQYDGHYEDQEEILGRGHQ